MEKSMTKNCLFELFSINRLSAVNNNVQFVYHKYPRSWWSLNNDFNLIKIISLTLTRPLFCLWKIAWPKPLTGAVCVRDSFRKINSILFRGCVFWQSRFILADFCFRLFWIFSFFLVFFYYNRLPFSPHGGKTCNLFGWSRFACQVEAVPNLAKADGRRGGGLPAGEDPYRLRNQTVSPNLEGKRKGRKGDEVVSLRACCMFYVSSAPSQTFFAMVS